MKGTRVSLPDGYFHGGDIYAYRWLARRLPRDGAMVELGSFKGRSICAISSELRERNVSVTLVDRFLGLPDDPYTTETLSDVQYHDALALESELRANLEKFKLDATIVKSDSAEAAAAFADESLDFVFIDADHQYDAVLRDLSAWWPKVKPTGFIGGHDYSAEIERRHSAPRYGTSGGYHVARALRDFFRSEREIKKVPRQPRTTVWYVDRDPSDDQVLEVVSTDDLERSLRTHLRPEKAGGIRKRQVILENLQAMSEPPTFEGAIYACAADPRLGCHFTSTRWFINRMLRSGHLRLVRRADARALVQR